MLREKGTGASPLSAGPSTVLSGEETPLRDEPIGPKAIRSVAQYLKGIATVSAFYLSNVEVLL